MTEGEQKMRYPIPPVSMTSESAAMAPTTPSTDAITGGRRSAGGPGGPGPAARLGLGRERFANRPLVRRLAAGHRCDRRPVQDRGPGTRAGGDPSLDGALAVR